MNLQTFRALLIDTEVLAWLSWIGFAIALIGLALSYYFYKRGTRQKQPYCLTFTQSISGNLLSNIPDFQITYKGHSVENIAITKLVFWNAGAETITSSDIPTTAPFLIELPENVEFLNYSLDFVKRKSNAIALNIDSAKRNIQIQFDYLDENDGFVIELLHTGLNDDAIKIQAIFKGAKTLDRRGAALLLSLPPHLRHILTSEYRSTIGLGLFFAPTIQAMDLYFHFSPEWLISKQTPTSVIEWAAYIIVYGCSLTSGWYLWRTRLPTGFNISA